MNTIYSRTLQEARPDWKRDLDIPKAGRKDTRALLRRRLVLLWKSLDRPAPEGFMRWPERALYSEFFEREAELILRERYPDLYDGIDRPKPRNDWASLQRGLFS